MRDDIRVAKVEETLPPLLDLGNGSYLVSDGLMKEMKLGGGRKKCQPYLLLRLATRMKDDLLVRFGLKEGHMCGCGKWEQDDRWVPLFVMLAMVLHITLIHLH